MRYLEATLILFVIFLCLGLGLTQAQERVDLSEQPSVEIKRNFGKVPQGQVADSMFEIINGSEYAWQIQGVRTTCHCTSAEILSPAGPGTNENGDQDKQRIVNPGERLLIKMRIDTAYEQGPVRQVAYVNLKYPGEAKFIRLIMEGEVLTKKN